MNGRDIYGLGHVSFVVTFCLVCLVFLSNVIFTPSQEFFYIYPVVYGTLFCHTIYVRSPRERNHIFIAYITLLSISIFCFTLFSYLKIIFLLFTLSLAYFLLSKTIEEHYRIYAPLIGAVLVMSIVLTQRGALGFFGIALDRFLSIWTMGIIVLTALTCIPSKLYHRVWRKSMTQYIKDFHDHIQAIITKDTSYNLDNLCQHIRILQNCLNYLKKDAHYTLYSTCFKELHVSYLNFIYLNQHSLIKQDDLIHLQSMLNDFLVTLHEGNTLKPLSIKENLINLTQPELYDRINQFAAKWNRLCVH